MTRTQILYNIHNCLITVGSLQHAFLEGRALGSVRIKGVDENNPNSVARVEEIRYDKGGVYVSNMNMPFNGTYSRKFFIFDKIEVK